MGDPRAFPIQPLAGAAPHPISVPWSIAEKAYSVYAGRYGHRQSIEDIARRGGFCAGEMDDLLPDWREEVSEVSLLRTALLAARRELDGLIDEHKFLNDLKNERTTERDEARRAVRILREACEAISKGAGPFSRDPLEHATNCVESMKADALEALATTAAIPLEE